MDYRHGEIIRMNVEGDRLSNLPDELIHKILSFVDIKEAIKTSSLSSRWRYIWISMPCLSFNSQCFSTLTKFSKFVSRVLSWRNNLSEVYSLKFAFHGKASQWFVKGILNYAFSHNIQQLNVECVLENDMQFPLSLFSSRSLKHLSLTGQIYRDRFYHMCLLTSTWELPSLTTLNLHSVTLRDDNADNCIGLFSKCANLKNLILKNFKIIGSNGFSICLPRLSNLTLENDHNDNVKVVNVVAPQLENLTIRSYDAVHIVISAPDLTSLFYKGPNPLLLSTDGFHSLETADICVSSPKDADAHQIVCLLQQLHNVHFLKLNLEIVELLSSSAELLLHQPSPFVNLKSLKIYPDKEYWTGLPPKKVATMSTEVKSYLLGGSPKSTFTMVLREISRRNLLRQRIL